MESFLLTRKQYDAIIDTQAEWMENNWFGLTKTWCLLGVRVYGSQAEIAELVKIVQLLEKLEV